ncbi:hypothetical protein [Amycolatopsis sp. NPDC004079]|uniref:hypothetical protein n=1 Tax=Amycolatopsis sp. NPDC004079 TaxID=3154549 RepID=UPI0033B07CCE
MPLVAEVLGLVSIADHPGAPPIVPTVIARAVLDGYGVHIDYSGEANLSHPTTSEWIAAAEDQGVIMLTLGMDPWAGRNLDDLDCYLSRSERLFMGRLRVHVRAGTDR